MSRYNILFKITGSIATYKSAALISKLVQSGCDVRVVVSEYALKFIGTATLEGLTGKQVYTDSFAANQVMSHIDLVKWADLTILCPATANTINKMASGIGDNLLTSLFLAHDWSKPYLIAPAMNTKMYNHPATKESLEKLAGWGVKILPVEEGYLACGDTGSGKLLEPEEIYKIIFETLEQKKQTGANKKILITSGGTRESIDGVRFISNLSTGKTGAAIANYFSGNNCEVTFLRAAESALPLAKCEIVDYVSFSDLNDNLKTLLSSNSYDAVIHLAAVSDYSPVSLKQNEDAYKLPLHQKIGSDSDTLTISLKKNPKIVEMLKSYSLNKNILLIGFKLTRNASTKERIDSVQRMFDKSAVDLVVANDIEDRNEKGVQTNFKIFDRELISVDCATVEDLSKKLHEIIEGTK